MLFFLYAVSCAEHCGGWSSCMCDLACVDFGDCCEDFAAECPDVYVTH